MKPCFIRKAPYKLPGTTRLVWAAVLCESQGLSVLFVQKPDDKWCHEILFATENIKERCFELANVSRFPVEPEDLEDIGFKLRMLADAISEDEIEKFFRNEGLW